MDKEEEEKTAQNIQQEEEDKNDDPHSHFVISPQGTNRKQQFTLDSLFRRNKVFKGPKPKRTVGEGW